MRFLTTDICFFICSAVIVACCLIFYYTHRKRGRESGRIFELLLFNMLSTSAVSILATGMNPLVSAEGGVFNAFQNFFQTIYFALHTLLAPLFALYVVMVNNWGENRSAREILWFLSPALLLEIFVLANPATHLIFYYQDNVLFTRGPLELFIYAEAAGYTAFAVGQLLVYRRVLARATAFALWLFIAASLVGVLVQFFWPWLKIELFFESVSLLGIMLLVEVENGNGDSALGVYNRRAFIADGECFARLNRRYSAVLFHFVDFGNFRAAFESEELEKALRNAVFRILRNSSGTLYRVSQDKVVVLSPFSREKAERFASKCVAALSGREFRIGDIPISVKMESAVLEFPGMFSPRTLLDLDAGETPVACSDRLERESALERAFRNGEFEILYQPIWNAETSLFDSAEIRLAFKAELGEFSPEKFLSLAERMGFANDFHRTILEKICRFASRRNLLDRGIRKIHLHLGRRPLFSESVCHTLAEIPERYGLSADLFEWELLDPSLLENAVANENFKKWRNAGFSFSAGSSACVNVARFSAGDFGTVKFDWNEDAFFLKISDALRKMNVDILQRGVDTRERLDACLKTGRNLLFGNFSKPLREDAFLDFLKERNDPSRREALP